MRLPLQREVARGEFLGRRRLVGLAAGIGGPGDHATDEAEPWVIGQRLPRSLQQRVLSGPARSDHQNQHRVLALTARKVTLACAARNGEPHMFTTRPEIAGTFGVVASTHWIASQVGMAVLERGGNAFDAAAATAFTLQVAEPHLNGPGGDAPIIIHSARTQTQQVICGQGVAPQAATLAKFRDLDIDLIPATGVLPAVVPGAFDAWCLLLRDWGTWELSDVLAFAIGYARNGIHIVPRISATIEGVRRLFETEWKSSAAVFLPGGKVPAPESLFARPALAATYERICREAVGASREARIDAARAAWYRGFVAEAVDRFFRSTDVLDVTGRRHRGLLAADDFARWSATVEDPVAYDYHGHTVLKCGPWSQGPVVPATTRIAARLRHRRDGPARCGLRAHRRGMRQARLRRSRGLLRRSEFRQRAARRVAVGRLQCRPAQAGRARQRRWSCGPGTVPGYTPVVDRDGASRAHLLTRGAGRGRADRGAPWRDRRRHLPSRRDRHATATWSAQRHQAAGCNPRR